MKKATIKKLEKIGVLIHRGGFYFDAIGYGLRMRPVCAMWHESEEPTKEEIDTLAEFVRKRLDEFSPQDRHEFLVRGVNTTTVKKENGKWTFRHLTWDIGPTWHPEFGSLEEIKEKL